MKKQLTNPHLLAPGPEKSFENIEVEATCGLKGNHICHTVILSPNS